jgi:hypothetical protein
MRSPGHACEQRAHLLEPSAQLRVADVYRQHRILERREQAVRLGGGFDGALEKPLHATRWSARNGRLERAALQAVAFGERGVRTLGAAVGQLEWTEQLLLERVSSCARSGVSGTRLDLTSHGGPGGPCLCASKHRHFTS